MKKKGFTLIELLAVIVILAIIALIATPLVLKYIEKSRKESKVDSAYSFVRNLETEIANYSIKHNGKKYNKSGLVEIGDLTDIDTTVKGDKPDAIKVCLSSLGQVDKAMFEYGNYYVSYDGKKGSISDKDTYDNFSCSDNQTKYLFEANMEFSENKSSTTIDKALFEQFKPGYEYDIIIDDKQLFTSFSINYENSITIFSDDYIPDDNMGIGLIVTENNIQIISFFDLEEIHNIKISYPNETDNKNIFLIADDGQNYILGYDFVEGDAQILIEDEDGNVYFDQNVILESNDYGIIGADSDCRNNIQEIPEIFSIVNQGKKIKVSVIQNINGIDVKTIVADGALSNKIGGDYAYYIGRLALLSLDGC